MNTKRELVAILATTLIFIVGCKRTPNEQALSDAEARALLKRAEAAFREENYSTAEQLARRKYPTPYAATARLLLGHIARETDRPASAIEHFLIAAGKDRSKKSLAKCLIADTQFYDLGRSDKAEEVFREVIAEQPTHALANQGLGMLLYIQGRIEEATTFLLNTIRHGKADLRNLIATGWTQVPSENPVIDLCLRQNPLDPYALLAKARIALYHNRNEVALVSLRKAETLLPNDSSILGALGITLVRLGRADEAKEWSYSLTDTNKRHSDVALALGLMAETAGELHVALRHYTRSFRRNPDHAETVYRIGKLIAKSDQPESATFFLQRAQQLEELSLTLGLLARGNVSTERVLRAAQLTEKLNRTTEALAWYFLLNQVSPKSIPGGKIGELRSLTKPEESVTRTDLSQIEQQLPLDPSAVTFPPMKLRPPTHNDSDTQNSGRISFEDSAATLGFEFTFISGTKDGEDARIHEMMGGGSAILDFDSDGWPDVWCTQSGNWADTHVEDTDRVFRNIRGELFADVTASTQVTERAYSQGPAVGDVNQDGFDDVFIANLGANSLFLNNGDGTFSEADIAQEDDKVWSTSTAIADFNGDTFPEILTVNYLTGEDAFVRQCNTRNPENDCRPALFDPVRETLLLNHGDGTFRRCGLGSGLKSTGAYGLGVVVGNFDTNRGLDVFVANDFAANFLYLNRSSESTAFEEHGLSRAAALDRNGRYQACMGVAAFDANSSGRTDLFITNFSDESNTLYEQDDIGFFSDRTRPRQLRNSGFDLIGFGTQAIDADNNGMEDLIVANGALADSVPSSNGMTGMPTLFLQRTGEVFRLRKASEIGSYFSELRLGRGVSRGDLNCDGLNDAIISNLNSPLAVLMNTSESAGNALSIKLTATKSERNGIGTKVTAITKDNRPIVRNLTAGDGYMASNDRTIIIGTGKFPTATVTITWPDGQQQELGTLAINKRWHVVQNRGAAKITK